MHLSVSWRPMVGLKQSRGESEGGALHEVESHRPRASNDPGSQGPWLCGPEQTQQDQ